MSRLAFVLLFCGACERAPAEPPSRERSAPQQPAPAAPASAEPERPFRFPAPQRLVAIGDVHGDLGSTREALRLAAAIDSEDRWIGRDLVVVQTGDQLDRGDEEKEILDLFDKLGVEAAQAGGAFHVLNGNHEIMNVAGDLRYVTPDGLRDFATTSAAQAPALPRSVPEQARGRALAFTPGAHYARRMAARNTLVIVGDTLFAHAGVLPQHVSYGIGRINAQVSRFMRGELRSLPEVVAGDDGPVWTRAYGGRQVGAEACKKLESVLAALSVRRLVVGHTVQDGGISSACEGRVFRIDVGLSDYYGKQRPTQVLEIQGDRTKVLGPSSK